MLNQRCWVSALTLAVAVAAPTVSPATAGIIYVDRSAFESAAPNLLTSTFDGLVGTPAYPQNYFNGPGAIDQVFSSMRVGEAQAPAASRPAQGASGLYLATVRRLVFRATGGSEWTLNIEYYLLDPDGKLYHGWLPEAPGGGFLRFDYDEARRPGNSAIGSYTVSGNRVSLNVGLDKTTGTLLGPDELEIRGTKFKRSVK